MNNHYVSFFYLKNFTQNGIAWRFDKTDKNFLDVKICDEKGKRTRQAKGFGAENDLYSDDQKFNGQKLEYYLRDHVEPDFNKFLYYISLHKNLPGIEEQLFQDFLKVIDFQIFRIPKMFHRTQETVIDLMKLGSEIKSLQATTMFRNKWNNKKDEELWQEYNKIAPDTPLDQKYHIIEIIRVATKESYIQYKCKSDSKIGHSLHEDFMVNISNN